MLSWPLSLLVLLGTWTSLKVFGWPNPRNASVHDSYKKGGQNAELRHLRTIFLIIPCCFELAIGFRDRTFTLYT